MTAAPVRIGIIDSGVSGPLAAGLTAARSFIDDPDPEDSIGHGTRIAEVIAEQADDAALLSARVFGTDPVTKPAVVAEAVDWLTDQAARIISMSFGLTADRAVLAEACERAAQSGIILIASAPAQGAPCFPAAYGDVIAVTGDARCDKGEVSFLNGLAEFGTWCASPEQEGNTIVAGASVAAGHFSGLAGRWIADHPGATRDDLIAYFRSSARFAGPERRTW